MKSFVLPGERIYGASDRNGNGDFWKRGSKPYRGEISYDMTVALKNGTRVSEDVIEQMVREWKSWRKTRPELPGSSRYDDKFIVKDEGGFYSVLFSKSVLTNGDQPEFLGKFGRGYKVYRDEVSKSEPMHRIHLKT